MWSETSIQSCKGFSSFSWKPCIRRLERLTNSFKPQKTKKDFLQQTLMNVWKWQKIPFNFNRWHSQTRLTDVGSLSRRTLNLHIKHCAMTQIRSQKIYLEIIKMYPLENLSFIDLSLKIVMLMTLLTGQRGQTIHSLYVNDVVVSALVVKIVYSSMLKTTRPGYHLADTIIQCYKDPALCLVKTLSRYIEMSSVIKNINSDKLSIITMKPHKGVPRDTIRRWLKTVMKDSGIDVAIFTPHTNRAAATSAAKQAGVTITDIMQCAGWTNAQTFHRYYGKLISQSKSVFSARILDSVWWDGFHNYGYGTYNRICCW